MVQLNKQYNVDDPYVQGGSGESVLIPQGDYQAKIVNSELKQNSKGTGQYLELTTIVTAGDYQGTEFFVRLNLVNDNPQAEQIAYKDLAKISNALGLPQTPADSAELHNRPHVIEVKTKPAEKWTDKDGVVRDGKEKSEIKGWKPLNQGGQVTTAPAVPQATAQASAPASQSTPWG